MRRSLLKLVVGSVLACWAMAIVVIVFYSRSLSWTDERAQTDGVFLAYELLNNIPHERRSARLQGLQQHFSVNLGLVTIHDVERRLGRSLRSGERIPHRVSPREEWYFLVFEDGLQALAAGPVNPMAAPPGFIPIGAILAILGLPIIAGLIALRVERRFTRVERASEALAAGDLGARVNGKHASYDELATNFNRMAERLETLIRSRDELVQAVSHELGSPLSRLRFHMELFENQTEDKREERIKAMTLELDALDELVAELLGYVQSDELDIEPKTFNPTQGFTDLAELARLEAPEYRTIEIDLELPNGVSVFADQRLFLRTVENVLRNAVRHSNGKVRLELTQEKEHIRVAVHDNGSGIPEDLREKVKIPFFRIQADRNRKTGGVGLGLAIVGRIMQKHGGYLEISDSPLGGATVATLWPKS
jgi:signal transduction histidine kinase